MLLIHQEAFRTPVCYQHQVQLSLITRHALDSYAIHLPAAAKETIVFDWNHQSEHSLKYNSTSS